MENSSYSKTRSPARFLAAFLAFVMVLIVMPVLPASAATITKVVFKGAKDGLEGQIMSFNDGTTLLSDVTGGSGKWGGMYKIAYTGFQWSGDNQADAEFTLQNTGNFGVTFNAMPTVAGDVVLCAKLGEGGTPKKLDYTGSCNLLYSALSGSGDTVYIYAEKVGAIQLQNPNVLTVTVDGTPYHGSEKIPVKVDGSGVKLTVDSGEDSLEVAASIDGQTTSAEKTKGNEYTITVSADKFSDGKVPVVRVWTRTKQLAVAVSGDDGTAFTLQGLSNTAPYGASLTFTLYLKDGYEAPMVTWKYTGESEAGNPLQPGINGNAYTYTIPGDKITKNITVDFKGASKKKVTVTWREQSNLFTFTDKSTQETSVESGTTVTFKVNPTADYTQSSYSVFANGTRIFTNAEGKYEFTVTENTIFSADGFTKNTYTISYPLSGNGYTVEPGPTSVTAGTSVSFRVTLNEGYEVTTPDKSLKDLLTGTGLTPSEADGGRSCTFTFTPSADVTISVAAGVTVDLMTFEITDKNGKNGYDLGSFPTGKTTKWGASVSFTVTPKEGYRLESVTATSNGAVCSITSAGNTYTIQNVRGPVEVTITVAKITFTVTYQAAGGKLGTENLTSTGGVKRTYQCDDAEAVMLASAETPHICKEENGGYSLELETPTRTGYIITEWTDASNGGARIEQNEKGKFEIRNHGDDDMNVIVRGTWSVDVSVGDHQNAFFFIGLTANHTDSNKDEMKAEIRTNLHITDDDYAASVTVKMYGVVYGNEPDIDRINDSCNVHTFDNGGYKTYNYIPGTENKVLYVKMGSGEHNENDTVRDGGMFTVRIGHSKVTDKNNCNRKAFAWVILSINGEDYLFKSAITNCGNVE